MKKAILAIDPGKAGFICLYINKKYFFYPMPYHKVDSGEKLKNGKPKMKLEFYECGFRDLVLELNEKVRGYELHAVIEEVIGREDWSAQNTFNFGYVAGMQKMICVMLGVKAEMVRPQKWQAFMYKGIKKIMKPSKSGKTMVHDTKATSIMVAKMLGGDLDFRRTVRCDDADDNKTDAFLMCEYKRRNLK